MKVTQKIEVPKKEVKEKEYTSTSSQLKTSNTTSKATTRIIKPKKSIAPQEPSRLIQMLTSYFTGGNLLVRIGGVILRNIDIRFLEKYRVVAYQKRVRRNYLWTKQTYQQILDKI